MPDDKEKEKDETPQEDTPQPDPPSETVAEAQADGDPGEKDPQAAFNQHVKAKQAELHQQLKDAQSISNR